MDTTCLLHFLFQLQPSKDQLPVHLNDKVKIAVRVPLDRDGLERAKPLVSKIYTREVEMMCSFIKMTASTEEESRCHTTSLNLLIKLRKYEL